MNNTAPFMAGGFFFLIWLGMMVSMIAGWILCIVALWRGMKAHESIAESLQKLTLKEKVDS